jgi:hypothetical protein
LVTLVTNVTEPTKPDAALNESEKVALFVTVAVPVVDGP